jgi:multidrug efflux pump subunit AcrA (membrane-fusion protein)
VNAVLQEGAKYLCGLLAVLVVAGESSFAAVEITKHVTASGRRSLEAQLTAARGQATAANAQVNAERTQLSEARTQLTAARAQVAAALADAAAARAQVKAKLPRAQTAAASAQAVVLHSQTPFAVAQGALVRIGRLQRQVAQAATKPHAQPCLLHVLNHELRQRRVPDALYRRHDYTVAARGYEAVAARLARKAARCDKGIKLTSTRRRAAG